jgi:hypothetical protein
MKIFKNIEVELSLPTAQRGNPSTLLMDVREKLARTSEVAPDVPESVITQYKTQFNNSNTHHPIIANGIDAIKIYNDNKLGASNITHADSGTIFRDAVIHEGGKEGTSDSSGTDAGHFA